MGKQSRFGGCSMQFAWRLLCGCIIATVDDAA